MKCIKITVHVNSACDCPTSFGSPLAHFKVIRQNIKIIKRNIKFSEFAKYSST